MDDRVSAFVEAVDGMLACAAALADVSDDDLCEMVATVPRVSDLIDVVTTEIVAEWDSRGLFRLDGSRSAGARLARDAGWSKHTADRVVRRGQRTRHHPLLGEAYRNGDLSTDKTDLLCNAALPARRALFEESEADRVSDGKCLSFEDLKTATEYWANAADDELGRDRSKGHQGRRMSCSRTLGGSVAIDSLLDPVGGTIVLDEIERLAQQFFEDDWAAAREQYGIMATTANLPRTTTQRRADAFVAMATRSATMQPGDGRVPRPLFSVITDIDTTRRICELADGTVIAPALLVPWLAEAEFERVIFDTPKRVIEIGVRRRFYTGALRRAIELRDRHCTFPGCHIPANRCDIDHIIEYAQGGPTSQANGRLRCPAHNRQRPGKTTPPPQGP